MRCVHITAVENKTWELQSQSGCWLYVFHTALSTNYCTSRELKHSSQTFTVQRKRRGIFTYRQESDYTERNVCGFKRNSATHTTLLLPHLKWTFNSIPLLFQFDFGYLVYTPRLFNEVSNHYFFPLSISLMKEQEKNNFYFHLNLRQNGKTKKRVVHSHQSWYSSSFVTIPLEAL